MLVDQLLAFVLAFASVFIKGFQHKNIMDGGIGHIEGISFIESPPCNELKEFLEATKQTITDALGIPAHFLKEPEL